MDKLLKALIICIGCLLLFAFKQESKANAELTVLFDNIRNKEGKLYIFVYSYENQYPDNPYMNFEISKEIVSDFGTLKFTIPENLQHGNYAVSILDDENANEDLDMFWGLPIEGYGFSNNIKPLLSMPDYDKLLFDLTTDKKTIHLTLQYLL